MAVSTLRAGLCLALLLASVPVAGAPTAPTPASARLDFDSFRREIEPIFLGYAYVHSLPDLKELTPDSHYIYVAAAGDNTVFVVDTNTLREVARIPVGQVPKRNTTARLQVGR